MEVGVVTDLKHLGVYLLTSSRAARHWFEVLVGKARHPSRDEGQFVICQSLSIFPFCQMATLEHTAESQEGTLSVGPPSLL